jgi:hypothetical protein
MRYARRSRSIEAPQRLSGAVSDHPGSQGAVLKPHRRFPFRPPEPFASGHLAHSKDGSYSSYRLAFLPYAPPYSLRSLAHRLTMAPLTPSAWANRFPPPKPPSKKRNSGVFGIVYLPHTCADRNPFACSTPIAANRMMVPPQAQGSFGLGAPQADPLDENLASTAIPCAASPPITGTPSAHTHT